MTEEEKALAEAEFQKTLEGLSDEEKTQKITEKEEAEAKAQADIDFKKEAERLASLPPPKPKRTPQEEVAFNLKKNAERARELGVDPNEVLGMTPNEPVNNSEFVTKGDMARDYARGLTKSEDELKVVMWQYEHGIQRTGDITNDIKRALVLAHAPRMESILSEIQRGKITPPAGQGESAGQKPRVVETIPTLGAEQQTILRRRGFKLVGNEWVAKHNKMVWNPTTRVWDTVKIQPA